MVNPTLEVERHEIGQEQEAKNQTNSRPIGTEGFDDAGHDHAEEKAKADHRKVKITTGMFKG
jgi:hypothetical protein